MNAGPYELAIVVDPVEKRKIVAAVLADLPQWFGRPEATRRYVEEAAGLSLIAARHDRGFVVGFVTLRPTSPVAHEIYAMGVLAAHHRNGIGRSLVEQAVLAARSADASLLTVKTVGASHPDLAYAATRAFYAAVGFVPVEEFPDFWGPGTPCLMMIRQVSPRSR